MTWFTNGTGQRKSKEEEACGMILPMSVVDHEDIMALTIDDYDIQAELQVDNAGYEF